MVKITHFLIVLTILFGVNNTVLLAQESEGMYLEQPRTFFGGLILGANFTQIDGDNYAGYHKLGLNFGGIIYTHLADHLAMSLEILYAQKGAKSNAAQENPNGIVIQSYKASLNYAEIPIQLNYFDRRKSHFGAGFSVSRFIKAKEEGVVINAPTVVNFDDYPFRKFDFNFLIGGSLHLVKGLFLNMRFQYSLTSIRKVPPPYFSGRNEQFNNLFALRLLYIF